MMTRVLPLLLALFALQSTPGQAQTRHPSAGSLPSFRSEQELKRHLQMLAEAEARRQAAASPSCKGGMVKVSRGKGKGAASARRDAVIRGRVANTTGAPLQSAAVSIDVLGIGSGTSEDGRYRIRIPPESLTTKRRLEIGARTIGYAPQRSTLAMGPGDSVEVDFTLCAAPLHLSEVVIAGANTGDGTESITNTQHDGVDEGGIVKLHGDHLVMLRRGRLFTVAMGDNELRPIAAVDAFGPGIDPAGTWYDELLVAGDKVVVIGYSYARGGTEIGVFRIDRDGGLQYLATHHLRSHDYYSSRNYASRLIGTKLVFYSPMYVPWRLGNPLMALPAMRKWREGAGKEDDFERIVTPHRVYQLRSTAAEAALHTVTVCDLASADLACEATVVIGPRGRVFYVSPGAVYIWASDRASRRDARADAAVLFRMPLDGSSPSALRVVGSPVDQFSFLESDDAHLNVLVRSGADGDAMWHAEVGTGDVALMRVPLASFGDGTRAVPRSRYRALPRPDDRTFENRFVGDHLLYGTGNGWGRQQSTGSSLYVVPWRGGEVARLELPHAIDRIEALGRDAVVVGTNDNDDALHFTGIRLNGPPTVAQQFTMPDASQGELRSHGFFYKPDGPDSGVLGLPVRGPGRPGYAHLFEESASILFLRNADRRFQELGVLRADEANARDDACRVSCIDWYGNSRPLFVRGRIFALLGYELVEGSIRDGRIHEVRRVSYAPPAAKTVGR